VVLAVYVVPPVPAYVYVTLAIDSPGRIPVATYVGDTSVPTATDNADAVITGAEYRAEPATVALCVVVFVFTVVTVTVEVAPLDRPVTVSGNVEPVAVPLDTDPADAETLKVVAAS
jgi:hypothetical protein